MFIWAYAIVHYVSASRFVFYRVEKVTARPEEDHSKKTPFSWSNGQCLTCDATCSDTFDPSYLRQIPLAEKSASTHLLLNNISFSRLWRSRRCGLGARKPKVFFKSLVGYYVRKLATQGRSRFCFKRWACAFSIHEHFAKWKKIRRSL